MTKVFTAVTLIFLFAGCAVHSPMSEMLMFQKKQAKNGKEYKARYSHAYLSFTTELYNPEAVNDYAEKNHPAGSESSYDYSPAATIMSHAIFMSDKTNNFAFSLGVGNTVGADATLKLFPETFLSGVINLADSPQGQVVLQQRLLDGNPNGLSIGLTYKRNYQSVNFNEGRCGICFNSKEFYSNTIGIRSVGILSETSSYGKSQKFLHVSGSLNYDLTMKIFYPQLGFSFGLY